MIDIHSHIIPGIDDGSRSMDETLEMLSLAAESGTKYMVATPHYNRPGNSEEYSIEEYKEIYYEVREAVKEVGIPIQICPGMEVFATWDLPERIKRGEFLTINGSKNLLIEFDFSEDKEFASDILERVASLGIKPVIAHVERYEFIQSEPRIINDWKKRGYRIQVNKGSVEGRFGQDAEITAATLLERRLVTVIASDAHRANVRTPYMKDIYNLVAKRYSEAYAKVLFDTNPKRICMDQEMVQVPVR